MAMHSNSPSDALKMEQLVTESFAKTLHIVLDARSRSSSSRQFSEKAQSPPSSSFSVRPSDKWFNLALKECPASLEDIDLWRQNNLEFVVIDIVVLYRKLDWKIASPLPKHLLDFETISSQDEAYAYNNSERIIERWVVQYEKITEGELGLPANRQTINSKKFYKKLVILLRSLYSTLRLLPANKLIQELDSCGEIREFTVTHRVSSFVEPFTRKEEAEMLNFSFSPVFTINGRFSLSVRYRSSLSDLYTNSSPSLSPKVIPDYVGSPLAHPLKRFPSFPAPRISPMQFLRRHSWSFNRFRASSPNNFPPNFDPSVSPFNNILRSESAPANTPIRPSIAKGFSVGERADSSNRIAINKGYSDEEEHSCPFDEGLAEAGGVRSRDAAVGELVYIMKGATPLERDTSLVAGEGIDAGGRKKTMADALNELRGYQEICKTLNSSSTL